MDICRTTTHVVKQGDTFYKLAQRYKTTVPDIIRRNPGINPYNLQVGTRLNICEGMPQGNRPGWPDNRPVWPGNRPVWPDNRPGMPGNRPGMPEGMPGGMPMPEDELEVNNDMRKAWTEHAFWTMIYQNSVFHELAEMEDVSMRLMQNAEDVADVFENFYSGAVVNQLTRLLMEHVRLAGEIMVSMRDNTPDTEQLERQWFQNAENIARLLSNANSEYSYEELLQALTAHLDMLKRQMLAAMNKEYENAIRLFDESLNQLLEMADYLTEGLLKQFYRS